MGATAESRSLPESILITRLYREGPTTTAELARLEGMKPPSMGATVRALEKRGLVERKPDPVDGRQVTIELTRHGVDVLTTPHVAKRAWLVQAVAKLPPADRATLFAAGEIMLRLTEF